LKFIKNSVDELLEKSLSIQLCQNIMNTISSVDGFYDPHDLRTRRIGSGIAIEIHLRFDKNMTIEKAHDIATEVEERVKAEYGEGTHIVTHLEV
jgi:divalent metal cation (Fe/Co/Zn/Cd) transporter